MRRRPYGVPTPFWMWLMLGYFGYATGLVVGYIVWGMS